MKQAPPRAPAVSYCLGCRLLVRSRYYGGVPNWGRCPRCSELLHFPVRDAHRYDALAEVDLTGLQPDTPDVTE